MPDMASTEFVHLNKDWNAEPNAPHPKVTVADGRIILEFFANPWAYAGFQEEDVLALEFLGCSRYRLGGTNDEGWFMGQCRFSKLAPKWGEFYEIKGDLRLDECIHKWTEVNLGEGKRHFLFYFRDETFECDADGFELKRRE